MATQWRVGLAFRRYPGASTEGPQDGIDRGTPHFGLVLGKPVAVLTVDLLHLTDGFH